MNPLDQLMDKHDMTEEDVIEMIQEHENIGGESSPTEPDRPNGNVTVSSTPKSGGEPPISNSEGNEDNSSSYLQNNDKPVPDAWFADEVFDPE